MEPRNKENVWNGIELETVYRWATLQLPTTGSTAAQWLQQSLYIITGKIALHPIVDFILNVHVLPDASVLNFLQYAVATSGEVMVPRYTVQKKYYYTLVLLRP